MPRRGANGRWISDDSQEARDQVLAEAILAILAMVLFLAFLAVAAIKCGGALALCQ